MKQPIRMNRGEPTRFCKMRFQFDRAQKSQVDLQMLSLKTACQTSLIPYSKPAYKPIRKFRTLFFIVDFDRKDWQNSLNLFASCTWGQ